MLTENARLILGLRAAGWRDREINDFLVYIATGDETYKPDKDAEPKAE